MSALLTTVISSKCVVNVSPVCFLQGIVSFADKGHQVMLQGVHELYELNETQQLWENPRINRLVFIGEDAHTLFCVYAPHTTLEQYHTPAVFS